MNSVPPPLQILCPSWNLRMWPSLFGKSVFSFFFFFWPYHQNWAVGTPTPNHWMAGEAPVVSFLMQLVEMRSYESEWAQYQHDLCQTHRGAHRKNVQKGGRQDSWSDASTSQGIQKWGMEPILLLSLQEGPSLPTPGSQTSDFGAVQESISCFTPPSLWHFVMIALGNQHTGFKWGLQQWAGSFGHVLWKIITSPGFSVPPNLSFPMCHSSISFCVASFKWIFKSPMQSKHLKHASFSFLKKKNWSKLSM